MEWAIKEESGCREGVESQYCSRGICQRCQEERTVKDIKRLEWGKTSYLKCTETEQEQAAKPRGTLLNL